MKVQERLFALTQKLERIRFVRTLRGALLSLIPILMIGAFALIGRSFPIPSYQTFIKTFGNGLIDTAFHMIHSATFGMLSVFMTVLITVSYRRESNIKLTTIPTAEITGLVNFFILSGVFSDSFTLGALGTKGMITAIICGYCSTLLYEKLNGLFKLHNHKLYSDGADSRFNASVSSIPVACCTILIFTAFNTALCLIFRVSTFWDLITESMTDLFQLMENGFFSGFLFVLISSILWFFGIHGSDCLEGVMENTYKPMIDINVAAVEAGTAPTQILTKQFFDVFVFMGGCGTAICLLLALFIFGRRKSDRELAVLSSAPMLFNINETMIFGMPVIFNPVLLIPFVITPLVSYSLTYLAMQFGIVGLTVSSVEWTTPVLLGGYVATAGVSGLFMQLFSIIVGVAIYTPFVRLMDKQKLYMSKLHYGELVALCKEQEESGNTAVLIEINSVAGDIAKQLAVDIKNAIERESLRLYYQPQASNDGKWSGAEALLRWEHPLFGTIYPPLVIEIASEAGCLDKLEKFIIRLAASQYKEVSKKLGENIILSVNITNPTLSSNGFNKFMAEVVNEYGIEQNRFCLEVTEQTAFIVNDEMDAVMNEIKGLGVLFAIDDFSMGQTSIKYLENKHFDFIKLDGTLVREMMNNPRCYDIICSIVSLSKALGIGVIAEYVETREQMHRLNNTGCHVYQGYLYSQALPLEKLDKIDINDLNKRD